MTDLHTIDHDLANLAAALGAPARVHIVRLLVRRGPVSVSEIVREMPMAQSTISEHLRLLREAGLVVGRKHGRTTHYEVEVTALRRLTSMVGSLATAAMSLPTQAAARPPALPDRSPR